MKHTMRRSRVSKTSLALTAVALTALTGSASAQTPFTPGNLVVSRVGTGAAALSSASTAVFLDEYTTATGQTAAVSSLSLSAAGTNPFTNSGSATSEGALALSTDGRYLLLGGYNAAPGVAAVAGTTSTAVPREVARVTVADRTVDTTTTLPDAYSANNIRSATSTDGTSIFTGGVEPVGDNGVRFVTFGAAGSTQLSTANPINVRVVNISGGQLFESTSGSTSAINPYAAGIYSLGTGAQTTGGQTATLIVATGAGSSPYDYVFTDANTVYVADDRTSSGTNPGAGGLLKYTNSGSGFTLSNTYNLAGVTTGTAGLRGLTYDALSGNFYAISSDNRLVQFSTSTVTFSTLATAPTNAAFRGIEFIPAAIAPTPEPGGMAALLIGFGALGLMVVRRRRAGLNQTLT